MSTTVCILANSLYFPDGGGHRWAYLNWALGVRANGCQVIWLERVASGTAAEELEPYLHSLEEALERYGLGGCLALDTAGEALPAGLAGRYPTFDDIGGADVLLNLSYASPPRGAWPFGRSALVDIDPGQLQLWVSRGWVGLAEHDVYFSIGETVGQPGSLFPDCGLEWQYTPPVVSLPEWPATAAHGGAFTTVCSWWEGCDLEFQGEVFSNRKRTAFLEYLSLPSRAQAPLELAIYQGPDDSAERERLSRWGWQVTHAPDVSATPDLYRAYVQRSRGEFSCAKPAYVRLQSGWISDRTICYLASGRPAVVQHTGPSRFLPDAAGLFRFRDLDEASAALAAVEADYARHARLARQLAEEHFDAEAVAGRVLERALA